ncbi:hypothetical protein FIBSPDRAFT_929271 [Athelia psychrophila]|uniref:Uncharacterized protein n=1 Tax=Athelia psychrophila TaxID=1759441 RepID=A0A166NRL3_9AGAM|nr:hypothetical protein FIBSPDRAFT_929271 [Fibularhizoctonia sp. CBS 109695]
MRSRDLPAWKANLYKFYAPRYRMPIRKSSKDKCPGPWKNYGAYFGRVGHAHFSMELLLREALTVAEEQEWKNFQKRRQHMASQVLLVMTRDLEREIKALGADVSKIARMMEYGRNKARTKDARDLKQKILEWITPGQPLTNADKKPDRGFNHQQIGALLCPVNLSWSDLETQSQLRHGTLDVVDCQWPSFLYPEGYFSWSNQWYGFLKSDILLKVYFALSSASYFMAWKGYVKELYDRLLDLLEDPRCEHEAEELMCWWNQQLFPVRLRLWEQQRNAKLEKAEMEKSREEDDIQDAFNAAFADVDFMSDAGEPEEGSEMDRSMMQLEDLIHVECCSDSAVNI